MQICCRLERDAVKKINPTIPVTTNFMEFYRPLDYRKWAEDLDFVAWDSYPQLDATPARMALNHELMRGLKAGQPFILMEQTPSVTNWHPFNALKRPGVMRLWSYQAVAHGSDSVMFFQMRRSIGACEKYHGAIIDHAGHENTRVFREAAALGAELEALGDRTLGTRTKAEAAILFDWENWWGISYSAGPSVRLDYVGEVQNYYTALHDRNVPADVIGAEDDFGKYKLLIAPMLYMVKPGVDEKLKAFVKNGGTLVVSYFSGYVDEHDLVTIGGYPGKLRELLGIWVEESDALPENMHNHFTWQGKRHEAGLLCDLLHSEGAQVLARYEEDFYAGMPVLTCNRYGDGRAYYVASQSDAGFYREFLKTLCDDEGIEPVLHTPAGVEAVCREDGTHSFLFLLNHSGEEKQVTLTRQCRDLLEGSRYAAGESIPISAAGVKILEQL